MFSSSTFGIHVRVYKKYLNDMKYEYFSSTYRSWIPDDGEINDYNLIAHLSSKHSNSEELGIHAALYNISLQDEYLPCLDSVSN